MFKYIIYFYKVLFIQYLITHFYLRRFFDFDLRRLLETERLLETYLRRLPPETTQQSTSKSPSKSQS